LSNIFLLRIFDLPENYLNQITPKGDSFIELLTNLFNDCYGQADFIGQLLTKNGYESIELIPNFKSAQFAWINEKVENVSLTDNWKREILEFQISYYRPEILFFVGWSYGGDYIKYLKEKFSFVKGILFWVGESLPNNKFYRFFDAIVTCDAQNVEILRSQGIQSEHVNHAFNFETNKRLMNYSEKMNVVNFSGTLKYGENEHSIRCNTLNSLSAKIDLELSGEIYIPSLYSHSLKGKLISSYHDFLDYVNNFYSSAHKYLPYKSSYLELKEARNQINQFIKLKEKMSNPLFGIKYLENLKKSLVVLNTHSNTKNACNMRLFEVTGVGSCLITDYKENIHELFEIDSEIVCYKSTEELIEKSEYLLQNPSVALQIANKGQDRTKRNHDYSNRLENYLDAFNSVLNAK
jgi:spore maturation protein CgeB